METIVPNNLNKAEKSQTGFESHRRSSFGCFSKSERNLSVFEQTGRCQCRRRSKMREKGNVSNSCVERLGFNQKGGPRRQMIRMGKSIASSVGQYRGTLRQLSFLSDIGDEVIHRG